MSYLDCGVVTFAVGEAYTRLAAEMTRSLHTLHPNLPVTLFGDPADSDEQASVFTQILSVQKSADIWIKKIYAISNSPYQRTLYLDADTHICGPIESIFDLLNQYDFALCPAPARKGWDDPEGEVPESYFMMNTGVIAYRRNPTTQKTFSIWHELYAHGSMQKPLQPAFRHDQPSFRWATWRAEASQYVLPQEFNVRARFPVVLKDRVRIVHELTKDLPDLAELYNAKTGLRSFPSLVSPQRVEVTAQPTAESITSDKSPSNHATEQQTLAALSNGTIRVQAILPRTDQIIELLSHARDAHLVQNVITTDEYSLGRFSKLQVDRVIDVGAHVGSATAYFLARYPRARVHAFEPNTTTFDLLSRNLGHDGRVTLHHAGWAGAGRRAELFEGERLSMASSVYTHANSAESSHTIELLDAAEAFDQSTSGTATILKIDTEGCELEILHRLGERLHRCDVIMLEYHSESDRRAIDAFLATTGFIMFGSLATQPHRGTLKFIRAELASSFDDGRHAGKPIEHHSQE